MQGIKDPLDEGIEHHQAGRLQEAEQCYRAVLAKDSRNTDALHLLGLLASQMEQHEAGAALIAEAIKINPNVPIYYNNLGTALGYMGKIREEEEAYRKALSLNPHLAAALGNLVRCLIQQGRVDEARRLQGDIVNNHSKALHLQAYQHSFEQRKKSPYMDYPAHVHMETMAKCNAACVFCPYPDLERQGEKMPDELIEKIISDLTDIPRNINFQLSPFKVNEPFLDVRLFDVLRRINEKLPNAQITLTSNATPITDKKMEELRQIKNIGYLWISFNDHREKEYEATMKLPYARTIERLEMIHAKKAAGEFVPRITLSRVGDGSPADKEFCQWVKQRFPLFETEVFQRGAWIGQVKDIEQEVPNVACVRWFDLSITATGVVAHCCMDGQAQWPIGDVRKQHVLEIYNSPEYRRLRENTRTRREVSPCNQCAFQ